MPIKTFFIQEPYTTLNNLLNRIRYAQQQQQCDDCMALRTVVAAGVLGGLDVTDNQYVTPFPALSRPAYIPSLHYLFARPARVQQASSDHSRTV